MSVFAEHETGLRFRPLPAKMSVLVYTDSASTMPMSTQTDKDQTMNGWRRPSKRVSLSVLSMMRWLVWWLKTILKKTICFTSGAEASACQDAFDPAECTRAIWYQVVIGREVLAGEWKEGHDYRLQELVRLLCQRCKRTWGLKDGVVGTDQKRSG